MNKILLTVNFFKNIKRCEQYTQKFWWCQQIFWLFSKITQYLVKIIWDFAFIT